MHAVILAALVSLTALSSLAFAETRTVVVDEQDAGTVRDAILDGFPGLEPKDGEPDFDGNALAVALKAGATELRAIVEFPLAELAGVAPADVVSATLTWNIDDVLSTLGPGTEFNGKAADKVFVHFFVGDGAVTKSDYTNTAESPATVPTGATITDASLNGSGAVVFTLDVRARVALALTDGTAFLGVLWRTDDSPTGTSLDNLGEGSGGPAGARGSKLPFLTIEVQDTAPPPGCGNGMPDAGEQCDDGNNTDGDCCSRLCTLDASGAACSDGNACTAGDTCDGAGTCIAGGPRSCDDGSSCTADACDPASGCVNTAVNEGLPCDDANVCTTGDVCGGGVCGGTPQAGSCDDGDPCTSDDTCTAGTCRGLALCGNGTVDASCQEECDDGNVDGLDGCSTDCRHDTLLGGTGPRECLLAIALRTPVRDPAGTIALEQRCTDNDSACDADPTEGVCGFDVAACLGKTDSRLPGCAAASGLRPAVVQPGRAPSQRANRTRLAAALADTPSPGCTGAVRIDVALRRRGKKPGKTRIVLTAKVLGAGRDRDTVRLVCLPAD